MCSLKILRNVTWGGVNPSRIKAFTLAEVLITLGIIGVVAALTLPSIIQSYQKQVTVNKLKKIYSTLSKVLTKSYADNGSPFENLTGEIVTSAKTKEYFESYWLSYFKSPIVAKNKFYSTTSPYYYLRGDLIPAAYKTDFNNGRILFSTADGTIISINIMTWDKDENGQTIALYYSKAAILVDINGLKGPNTYGKDVFTFSADYKDNKVYPSCIDEPMTSINNNCSKKSYGNCCIAKIIKDGWKIADDYPW